MLKTKLRYYRDLTKKSIFIFVEKFFKVHITPVHYYSPIPTVSELKPDIFTKVNDCVGVEFSDDSQLNNMKLIFSQYLREYTPRVNEGLSQVDSFVLYAMIRNRKPRVLIEIGSGESTKISLSALSKNRDEGVECQFTAIEPFPNSFLKQVEKKNFRLIESNVQDVDLDLLSQADILFIDSSHVAKIGSDVNYEIHDIVPRLKVGALVHWHDIMIPVDYPKGWLENGNMFWNESYMVHAFMMHNKSFRIVWASRYMQINYPEQLHVTFEYFKPKDPGQQLSSFWVERVG